MLGVIIRHGDQRASGASGASEIGDCGSFPTLVGCPTHGGHHMFPKNVIFFFAADFSFSLEMEAGKWFAAPRPD
jgi:hypothetical protein